MPDREVDELRGEIEVAVAVVVPEVAALPAGDRDRVDRVLHRPRVDDVALRVLDDLLAERPVGLDRCHRSSFARSGAIVAAQRRTERRRRTGPPSPRYAARGDEGGHR